MKKISSLVLALVASLCSFTAWAAEREAPTMPANVIPESGQSYFIFNTDAELFLSAYNALSAEGAQIQITITEGRGAQLIIGSYTLWTYYQDGRFNTIYTPNTPESTTYCTIEEAGDGTSYIQCSPYNSKYNPAEYWGVTSASTVPNYKCSTDDYVHWKIFTVEDGLRYRAELRLYKALNAIEAYGKGWYIENYETLYTDRANQTPADLYNAAVALENCTSVSAGYQAPWWNERPILFYTLDGSFGQDYYDTWALPDNSYTSGTYFHRRIDSGKSSSISATVLVEEPSTLVYSLRGDHGGQVQVYVDGVKVRTLIDQQYSKYPSNKTYARFFEKLEPGLHTITWNSNCWTNAYDIYLHDVGVMANKLITVNLLEPGSLGTEVLYNTDHIKNVRHLKVKGAMNNDDWARIKMMSTLQELDLSEAQFTEIPANQFKVSQNDTTMNFLQKVVLPEGLTTIGDQAFYYSFVKEINLPSTMKRVGKETFYCSHVKELIMPDNMTDFYGGNKYGYCFRNMYWLEKLVLPQNLTIIPEYTFANGHYIKEAVMPEKLQTVGKYAFSDCTRMETSFPEGLKTIEAYGFYGCNTLNSPLPESLTTIGESALQGTHAYTSIVIPQNVTSIGQYAFANCARLRKVELGVNQYSLADGIFQECSQLDTIKLKSPTVTTISSNYPHSDIGKVVLQVPHYLVNSYKLDSYWYNAKAIEPFDYSDVEYIPLHGNLTLNHERFGGQPSITLYAGSHLKINGDSEQKFNNIWANYTSQILNNCDNVIAIGDNLISYWTDAKRWYFISLPFDLDMTRITPESAGAQYAIRYYDGAGRAANGMSGNWKNVDYTGIIPAGTGFIYQTNISTFTQFFAADTENKYGTLRTTEFNKILAVNASETASNKGWNLVGNPYQCYYNNHCLNFTAPITVWNGSTYVAYSLTDDDYAIRPNEAFFVQCPNEEYTTLGFPLHGRQLTSVIESQNAVKAQVTQARTRQVVNLAVSNGEMEDMTRVVLNEAASLAYEINCDASKFMSMDGSVPQIYTLDAEGTQYAINERPLGEGFVELGFYAGKDGEYNISVSRNDAENVFIIDNNTGETIDITNGAYSFSAKAGTDNSRFTLSFVSHDVTAIQEIEKEGVAGKADVYSVDGKFLGTDASRLGAGVYVIRQGNKVRKVIVR